MNKSRKAAKLHNVISHDNDGNITLPAGLTLSAAPGSSDNSSKVTTTAWIRTYVGAQFANLVATAPATLDTLNELATALGNDPNFATTVTTSIGTRVPQARTLTINGVSFDLSVDRAWTIAAGLTSFNTRTGAITLTPADVTGALGFTPYNATNPSGYITGITSGMVTTALGYTPYNSSNPSGYITGISFANVSAKPTTLAGYGITDAASSSHNHDAAYVPLSRTLTINGVTFDLSANRSYTVSGAETDTLATVTARGASTGTAITINKTGTLISHAGMSDAIGYNSNYGTYIGSPVGGTYYIYGNGQMNNNGSIVSLLHSGNFNSYALPLTGGTLSGGITFTAPGGSVLLKHAVSEVDAWIFQENAANWGLYWKNAPSGHHTFGGYSTVGAELFGMSAANASGNGVTTSNFVGATSAIAQWMLSNYTGYIWSASTIFAAGDMRAPIFYDSQDTSFYLDPNSYSRLNRVGVGGAANDVSGININGDAGITGGNFIYFGHSNGSLGSWQTRTFASGGRQIWNTNGFEVNRDGYGGGWSMSINSTGSTTFNSTSDLPININGASHKYLTINPGNGYEAMVRYIGGSGSSWYVGKRTSGQLIGTESFHFYSEAAAQTVGGINPSGDMIVTGSSRAPIFYDSQDTGYYLDPNSESNLYRFTSASMTRNAINYLSINSPFTTRAAQSRNYQNGTMGWGNVDFNTVFSNWGSGFIDTWSTPANAPGGSSHYVGLQGMHYNFENSSQGYGFQMACAGEADNRFFWRSAWPNLRSWVEMIHTGNIASQVASHTSGNTNSISSAVGGSYTWTGVNYFRTNQGGYSGSLDSGRMQAYSDSNNSAFFSWHKGGHFATNMGLDADNVIRIGGWSMSANRFQMDTAGNLTMSGDITAYSDARVKTDIQTITDALTKVNQLRGVSYKRTDSDDTRTKIGVIAQETMKVVPEVVNQDNDGMYNVSYGNLGGLFIEAFKEQTAQIMQQKAQIDELMEIVKTLKGL